MSHPDTTIVALIALPEEYDLFKEAFPKTRDCSSQRQIRLEHDLASPGYRLISVLAEEMGSVSAAQSAEAAIADLRPNLVIVLGIAGGVSKDLMVGDVCVSNEVFDVLQNTKVSDSGGAIDVSLAPDFYGVDAELVASFSFLRNHPNLTVQFKKWQSEAQIRASEMGVSLPAGPRETELFIGPIACGPVSISQQFNEKLKGLHRKLLAIETESGGVFSVVSNYRVPAVAIRGISDLADAEKAALEKSTDGAARRLAMKNAIAILKIQLLNVRFLNVALRHNHSSTENQPELFRALRPSRNIVAEIDSHIKEKLRDLSFDFRARPEGFYLPMPRARRVTYVDNLTGRELDPPQNLDECLTENPRILVRLPRSFPSQALGWSLAHSLIRRQIGGKAILPFVVAGADLRPPKQGLKHLASAAFQPEAVAEDYVRVVIVEEPPFESRGKIKLLEDDLKAADYKVIVLTKAEDKVSAVDGFMKEVGLAEYEIAPVSFSETAFFLERTFDMDPREAEAVAIKLDDTFRRFRLDAHPTYFAGLQEETLAALINANKRAELIQLAVDGLLSLVVAIDKAGLSLSRSTRERFLRRLILEIVRLKRPITSSELSAVARKFLDEFGFEVHESEFLQPLFQIGILYQSSGDVRFSHPYLESYLLAQALRDDPEQARIHFDPSGDTFNHYGFDIYCELGPDPVVIENVLNFASAASGSGRSLFGDEHAFNSAKDQLASLSAPLQIASMSKGLMKAAEKMESDDTSEDVRAEKQKLIDAKRHVRTELGARQALDRDKLPEEIKREFGALDDLSRALSLTVIAVGAGAESLNAERKAALVASVIDVASRFADGWTKNRLRLNFSELRAHVLDEAHIWSFMEDVGAEQEEFDAIRENLELFLRGFELNFLSEPMGRVLWRICSLGGSQVLRGIVEDVRVEDSVQRLIRAVWLLEVDSRNGKDALKSALSDYRGAPLMRVILANHFLMRVFWHHYKRATAGQLINSAKRVLAPLGLAPPSERIEQARRGPELG